MAARARRRLIYDLAISLGITAVLFLTGEAVARLLQLRVGYFLIPTQANCLQRSATLGIEFRPECAAMWSESLLTGDKQTTFTTNRLGLRDAELDDDDAVRILALGDSCTWGWQVGQTEAYPQVLQRLLNDGDVPQLGRVVRVNENDRYIGGGTVDAIEHPRGVQARRHVVADHDVPLSTHGVFALNRFKSFFVALP